MRALKYAGVFLAAAFVLGLVVVFAGPTVYCPSVWLDGTVADERGKSKALDAIASAEGSPKPSIRLTSSARQFRGPRVVRELWQLEIGSRKVSYDVTFFYIPGGPICGPSFRIASRSGG
jgi:hypothetical protein